MRRLTALCMLISCLVLVGSAAAGGWASVTLDATPSGVGPGDRWNAQITVLRHGITPTDGAEPSVVIRNTATGQQETFPAEPTGKTGVYAAAVVFPESGEWGYSVNDGLAATGYGVSQVTEYPPVTITGSGSRGGISSFPAGPVLAALLAAAAFCAVAWIAVRRSRRLTPASR